MPDSPGLFLLAVLFGIVAAFFAALAFKLAYLEHRGRHSRSRGFEVGPVTKPAPDEREP